MENTIGDVPIQWFRDEEHIGYDADGRKILKRARVDHLDHLLQMVDDPTYWRKVFDEREDKEIDISKEQVRETIWFRDEEHIGYDADGRKILKRARVDHLDHLLQMVDDPTYWRKVFDEREDKEIDISKEQVRETIKCTL